MDVTTGLYRAPIRRLLIAKQSAASLAFFASVNLRCPPMDVASEKPAEPPRRWFQFSLRTLLIVVTVASVTLGWIGWRLGQVRREQATIAWVVEMGGRVDFPSGASGAAGGERSWWVKTTAKWFGERVWSARLSHTQVSDLSPLVELKNLEWLMVRLQRLTGMRPEEVCMVRPVNLNREANVWLYRPASHKTEHHGRDRVVPIGPKAQGVLLRYLARDAETHCFRPM